MEALLHWFSQFVKVARYPVAALALASGFALFAPASALSILGLVQAVDDGRRWIGTAFLVSTATLLTDGFNAVWKFCASSLEDHRHAKLVQNSLKHLTEDEKRCLRPFIENNLASVNFAATDGVARGLCAKGLLYLPSSMGHMFAFPYNIRPPARQYLLDHPDLLTAMAADDVNSPRRTR
jgi:hypothetical protein